MPGNVTLEANVSLLRYGQPYVDEGVEVLEKRYQEGRIKHLTAAAKDLGYQLTPEPAEA